MPAVNVPALTTVGLNSTTSSAWPFCFCESPNIAAIPVAAFAAISYGRNSPAMRTVLPSMTRVTVSDPLTRINGVDFSNPCF